MRGDIYPVFAKFFPRKRDVPPAQIDERDVVPLFGEPNAVPTRAAADIEHRLSPQVFLQVALRYLKFKMKALKPTPLQGGVFVVILLDNLRFVHPVFSRTNFATIKHAPNESVQGDKVR